MRFAEGDLVLARMPSSDEYERAMVVNVRGSKYKVKFEGGSELTLGEGDVRARRTSRSQTRTGKTRGGKSPSRRSPGRKSPGRSPGRPPKSPSRASNAESRKLPLRQPRQAKISIARLEIPKDNSSDTDRTEGSESLQDEYLDPSVKLRLKELGPVTRRSIRIMSNVSKAEHEQKLAALRGADRSVSLPADRNYDGSSEGKGRGLSMQPGDDILKMMHYEEGVDADSDDKHKKIDLISKPQEWGGWFGALLLILFLPLYTVLLQLVCMYNSCKEKNIYTVLENKRSWRTFFDLHAFLAYAGFIGLVSITSALPIGRLIDGLQTKTGSLQYRINGIWICLLSIAAFCGLKHLGYNPHIFIVEKLLSLSVAGMIYGILLAIALYVKANRVPVASLNIHASTRSRIYNFWQGKEVNPRIGRIDIKLVLCRVALIGTVLVNLAMIMRLAQVKGNWKNVDFAPLAVASLQSVYALDALVFESGFVTQFEVLYEGTGYMLAVGYLAYPFLTSVNIRYLSSNKVPLHIYLQYLLVVSFVVGYLIYRLSNRQKDKFRKNPFDSSVSHLETVPTKRGTRLLVSGWWGYVRHPNYLGDLLMHWSIAFLSFSTTSMFPYILAVQTTLILLNRAIRVNARCDERYGYTWSQYCAKVKVRLGPF